MAETGLVLDGVCAGHAEVAVLQDVSLRLGAGQSLALLGRNGMGKSTLLATVMGLTRQSGGRVWFDGKDISAWSAHRRARAGLGWVPQERNVFGSLSVEENLTVVARPGPWSLPRVYAAFARLRERRHQKAHQLSGGEQQMLAIGRALMLNPRVLLLDEPLEGLAPLVAQEVLGAITAMLREEQMGVLLVEQHALQVLPITQRALVLDRGRVAYAGTSAQLLTRPQDLEQWLGVRPAA